MTSIDGVSSSAGWAQTTSSTSTDNERSKIEKQISELQKAMREVQNDKELDAQTKSQQVAVYQAQIGQLQAQLTQSSEAQQVQAQGGISLRFPTDRVEISEDGRQAGMPPPLDFNNMDDDALRTWLSNMQAETGAIPGLEDSESLSVSSLTSEELQALRESLSTRQNERMEQFGGAKMPPLPPPMMEEEDA